MAALKKKKKTSMAFLFFFFRILFLVLSSDASSKDESNCVYRFQVWNPDQDVLQRIRQLEERCHSAGSSVDHQVALMRGHLANEMFEAINLTRNVEKSVLEQRLQDAHQNLVLRDIRLEMVDLKGENAKLWEALNRPRTTSAVTGSGSNGQTKASDFQDIHNQLSSASLAMTQLKNGVGDLKAEWLLLKREVQVLRVSQNSLREDAVKLKGSIETVRAEGARLREDMQSLEGRGTVRPATVSSSFSSSSFVDSSSSLSAADHASQLVELRMMTSHLEGELTRMRHENAVVRNQLLTSALTHRNMTREEVGRIVDRITSIQNASYLSTIQQRNTIPIPKDCHDVYKNGNHASGVYQIRPDGMPQLDNVYCEMVNGSGWTVVQRRVGGTLSFVRPWLEYKYGFGSEYGEYWAGNELIHRLTSQRDYRLRIDIWDFEGGKVYAEYDMVRVDSELNKYRLHVRGYRGNSGDSLSYHDDMAFSTEDVDNDLHMSNCAEDHKGGWWFHSCLSSNLNGVYHPGRYPQRQTGSPVYADGIVWYTFKDTDFYSLKRVEMKVRPVFV